MKIKTGDTVTVIAGNSRGQSGKVVKTMPREDKVVIEGINIKAKHVKGENGGIIRFEHPIHVSNVTLADSKKKPAKTTTKSKKDDKVEEAKPSTDVQAKTTKK